jgi:ribonuclease-3
LARPRRDFSEVEERIGYRFQDPSLLREALTHVSAGMVGSHYQRLEFLGDRVLGLAIADMLCTAFPEASEGDLSRRLSELVRKETCAEVADAWELGPYLSLGGGGQAGMRRNRSVLADACEAVIGAVFREGGFEAARHVVERGFAGRLAALTDPPNNPKAALQEWALGRGLPTPAYDVAERTGPDHAPQFRITVSVHGLDPAIGLGRSKRNAEQEAARHLLLREGIWTEHHDRIAG